MTPDEQEQLTAAYTAAVNLWSRLHGKMQAELVAAVDCDDGAGCDPTHLLRRLTALEQVIAYYAGLLAGTASVPSATPPSPSASEAAPLRVVAGGAR